MADTALVLARAFVERQSGRVKVETKEKFGELIVELYRIWYPSRFGSYDAERRVHDNYFAASYPSDPRMPFAPAAMDHGMWEMRERFPDADEAVLQKVLQFVVDLFEAALMRLMPVRLSA